jgi:subtilase family serine protease
MPANQEDQPPVKGNMMYIGPTIARLGLKSNTVVKGTEMLPQLKSIIDTHPVVGSLYVPTSEVGRARRNKNVQGSVEHIAVQTMTEVAKKYKQ